MASLMVITLTSRLIMPTSHGTIAITARGDGSRWYGRISISLEIAQQISINEGDRVSARFTEEGIIIYPDEHGRIKIPEAKGKNEKKHAFEAATTTLGLKEIRLSQQAVVTEIIEGTILVKVPVEFLAGDNPKKRKPRKKTNKPVPPQIKREYTPIFKQHKIHGSAAAIVTEASRSGKKVRPMSLKEIIDLLIEKGQDVKVLGPRFFKLNGKSVTQSDLADTANKISGCTDQDRIILVMD